MSLLDERKKQKLTQEGMARLLEIPLRSYCRIEESNSCSLQRAHSISQVLGRTIEEIFFDTKKEDS